MPTGGLARSSNPWTSHAAARSVNAQKIMDEIYAFMSTVPGGCISDEVVHALPHHRRHTIVPRFAQMVDKGMIECTGQYRPGVTGRQQEVRKVLPPPFIPTMRKPTKAVQLLLDRIADLEAQLQGVKP